ncbi:glycosyl transferase [Pasteurellaceae bacterium RH1A]|nr:glycosyl transferase [Pasteurellaceae bacterium RH1A]
MYKAIALIPHYNHSATVGQVAQTLLELGWPVLIIDDGSSAEHIQALKRLEKVENLQIHYCPQNGGKGAAMKVGFCLAYEQGFSHALQVDADGQHQLADSLKMREKSQQNPTALICGNPVYGQDAPKARLYGRKITDFWNAIHTHSFDIKDGMCGFRLYPLASTIPLIEAQHIGNGMDFDIEIIIKAHWQQIPLEWVDTPIRYAENGISHFRGWADNWLISKMHTRLFWGMVGRVLTGKKL